MTIFLSFPEIVHITVAVVHIISAFVRMSTTFCIYLCNYLY